MESSRKYSLENVFLQLFLWESGAGSGASWSLELVWKDACQPLVSTEEKPWGSHIPPTLSAVAFPVSSHPPQSLSQSRFL